MSSQHAPPQKIVIAGAGVMGISTAYYLATTTKYASSSPLTITLVDPSNSIAPAASGKAAGFLGLDWNDSSPLEKLARRGFHLHEALADDLGKESIMSRRLTCASITLAENQGYSKKKFQGIEWVQPFNLIVANAQSMGDESTIAQVHPKMLCNAMWNKVKASCNAELKKGEVLEPVYSNEQDKQKLIGARLADGTIVDADAILFACGPWTTYKNRMTGIKYHSAIIPTPQRVLTQTVFFVGCLGEMEVYPRPDGTAYCVGYGGPNIRVTERPGEEEVESEVIERIVATVREVSGIKNSGDGNNSGEITADPDVKQACYLPITPDGLPMMGKLSSMKGCYIAAGHSCWGILFGPATGETMAELIMTGKSTEFVDLTPFNPERF